MIYRISVVFAAISLLLCMMSAFFWIRSYCQAEEWTSTFNSRSFPGQITTEPDGGVSMTSEFTISRTFYIGSNHGQIFIGTGREDDSWPGFYHREDPQIDTNCFFLVNRFKRWPQGIMPDFSVGISYAIPTTLFALLAVGMLLRSRRAKLIRGFDVLKNLPA